MLTVIQVKQAEAKQKPYKLLMEEGFISMSPLKAKSIGALITALLANVKRDPNYGICCTQRIAKHQLNYSCLEESGLSSNYLEERDL
ncbi:MAG: hypothetical protein KUG72_13660 [Pseudomonadales bacterium]|nr:hypothetical protein [Pseudomonadales bacterium]